jgi:hypothetical protein
MKSDDDNDDTTTPDDNDDTTTPPINKTSASATDDDTNYEDNNEFDDFDPVDDYDFGDEYNDYEDFLANNDPFYAFIYSFPEEAEFIEDKIINNNKKKIPDVNNDFEKGLSPDILYEKWIKNDELFLRLTKKNFFGIPDFFEVMIYLLKHNFNNIFIFGTMMQILKENIVSIKTIDLFTFALTTKPRHEEIEENKLSIAEKAERLKQQNELWEGINSQKKMEIRKNKTIKFPLKGKNQSNTSNIATIFEKYEKIPIYEKVNGKMIPLKDKKGQYLYLNEDGEIVDINGESDYIKVNEKSNPKEYYFYKNQLDEEMNNGKPQEFISLAEGKTKELQNLKPFGQLAVPILLTDNIQQKYKQPPTNEQDLQQQQLQKIQKQQQEQQQLQKIQKQQQEQEQEQQEQEQLLKQQEQEQQKNQRTQPQNIRTQPQNLRPQQQQQKNLRTQPQPQNLRTQPHPQNKQLSFMDKTNQQQDDTVLSLFNGKNNVQIFSFVQAQKDEKQ